MVGDLERKIDSVKYNSLNTGKTIIILQNYNYKLSVAKIIIVID